MKPIKMPKSSKAPRRKRKGRTEVLVREKKHRFRKARTYWRPVRPRSSKRIKGKKVTMQLMLDPAGRIMGFKPVKKKR